MYRSGAVVSICVVLGCQSPMSASEGGEESESESESESETETESDTESGADGCPELVWSDPETEIEFAALQVVSLEETESLPPYTRIEGSLWITGVSGLVDLRFLECLVEVQGGLSVRENPDLETFDGLQRFTRLSPWISENASVWISDNPNLRTLDGLSGLEELPRVYIRYNPLLEAIDGLQSLRTAEQLELKGNDALIAVSLPSIESIETLIIGGIGCPPSDPEDPPPVPVPVGGNASLVHLDGLESLVSYGDFLLMGNPSLVSIEGILGASGVFNWVQLNESLPYAQILELSGSLLACGNLDEPEACLCEIQPP